MLRRARFHPDDPSHHPGRNLGPVGRHGYGTRHAPRNLALVQATPKTDDVLTMPNGDTVCFCRRIGDPVMFEPGEKPTRAGDPAWAKYGITPFNLDPPARAPCLYERHGPEGENAAAYIVSMADWQALVADGVSD